MFNDTELSRLVRNEIRKFFQSDYDEYYSDDYYYNETSGISLATELLRVATDSEIVAPKLDELGITDLLVYENENNTIIEVALNRPGRFVGRKGKLIEILTIHLNGICDKPVEFKLYESNMFDPNRKQKFQTECLDKLYF
jgi:ribosomal protein S3